MLTKTKIKTAKEVVRELIAKKKSEVAALNKAKQDSSTVKTTVVDLIAVNSLLNKELKAIEYAKKDKPKKKETKK